MNIIIISTMYPNSQIYQSGIFVHEQVRALIKLGVNIKVFAPIPFSPFPLNLFSKKWQKLKDIPKYEIIDDVEIIHSRYFAFPKGFLKQYWSFPLSYFIKRELKEIGNQNSFNIIHAHGSIPDDHSAMLLSKSLKLPYIITVHGETVYMKKKKSHTRKSVVAINKARAVIGVSENVLERIKKKSGRTEGLSKIFNGFTPEQIDSKAINKNGNEINILFGASLIERKGCEFLLRAFSNLLPNQNNIKLTIAGGGELFNKLEQLSKELKIKQYTKFLGTVSHGRMLELMDDCDIFALPSWDEAFGVVYLEAMSFKKPVIGTLGEGIGEVIKHGINGLLVEPKNSKDLSTNLSLLIEDKQLREDIGKRGFESIQNLTWENNAHQMLEIYRNIKNSIQNNIKI